MISDEVLERVIDRLVAEGKVVRVTMPNGEPGIRLVKEQSHERQRTEEA